MNIQFIVFLSSTVRVKLINSRMYWQLMMISLILILKKGTNSSRYSLLNVYLLWTILFCRLPETELAIEDHLKHLMESSW